MIRLAAALLARALALPARRPSRSPTGYRGEPYRRRCRRRCRRRGDRRRRGACALAVGTVAFVDVLPRPPRPPTCRRHDLARPAARQHPGRGLAAQHRLRGARRRTLAYFLDGLDAATGGGRTRRSSSSARPTAGCRGTPASARSSPFRRCHRRLPRRRIRTVTSANDSMAARSDAATTSRPHAAMAVRWRDVAAARCSRSPSAHAVAAAGRPRRGRDGGRRGAARRASAAAADLAARPAAGRPRLRRRAARRPRTTPPPAASWGRSSRWTEVAAPPEEAVAALEALLDARRAASSPRWPTPTPRWRSPTPPATGR